MRTCVGCRRKASPEALTRVIRRFDGTLEVGRSLPGRGAWFCTGSLACINRAEQRGAFQRALRGPLEREAIHPLREKLEACARMEGFAGGYGGTTERRG